MALKHSTGLRNALLATNSFRGVFNGACEVRIFAGPIPVTADDATTGGTLLVTILADGTDPLEFEAAPDGGVLLKSAAQSWAGTVAASGTAAYYRLVLTGDTNALSTTAPRQQGTVGVGGADIVISSTALVSGGNQPVLQASFTQPAG